MHVHDTPWGLLQPVSDFLRRSVPVPGSLLQRWHSFNYTADMNANYTTDVYISPDEVAVLDDKATKSGWIFPQQVYMCVLCALGMLACTWSMSTVDVETANEMVCKKFSKC